MVPQSSSDRTHSLESDRFDELFDERRLPATTDELVAEFGDVEITFLGGGSERLEDVLRTSGAETYTTVDDLRLAVLNGVERDAVGRFRYSDRDPPVVGEKGEPSLSF